MSKSRFGDLLQAARRKKGLSLRNLAERTGLHYSRLSRIEHGTRPAPGLAEIRLLADSLDVDMSDLLVSTGTSRDVVEHLVWSEKLQTNGSIDPPVSWLPEWSVLFEKNTRHARVVRRDGALCTVLLGDAEVTVFDFSRARDLIIAIPPEAVLVFREHPGRGVCSAGNVLPVRVKKLRHIGQVSNLVLEGEGMEINALHMRSVIDSMALAVGDPVVALIPTTAIRTSSVEEAE